MSQEYDTAKNCYSDKAFDKEKVFTKMLRKPYFKGGHDSLINFLITNISFQNLVGDLSQNERIYYDTARIKFIVSKTGALSDLSVTLTKKKIFADEILKVIKKSSCRWTAGGTELLMNGWIQFDIYYSIDRRFFGVTMGIKIKEYDYATE
jgi:hypothetical protein